MPLFHTLPPIFWQFLSFGIAFLLVLIVQPSIAQIALVKNFDHPADNQYKGIPQLTLGGIAIFTGTILSMIFSVHQPYFSSLRVLISAMIIMLFTGLLLDCRITYKYLRFFSKLFASMLIVLMGHSGPSPETFALPPWITQSIQILAVIAFMYFFHYLTKIRQRYFLVSGYINALIFGILFFVLKEYDFSSIAFALIGSLSGSITYASYAILKKKPLARIGHTGIYIIAIVLASLWLKLAAILVN